ncbi:MAG TPA: phage tail sheath C-terminal domain-containing protein [Pseudonocardiaceae bacterium]
MPVSPTYPGVYLTEVTSPVHTITGVPTSIAAFVGPAAQGPVNVATQINSWTEFERTYGGLAPDSEMTYGVYQFFLNGGATAQVIRVTGTPVAPQGGTAPPNAAKAVYLIRTTTDSPPKTLSLTATSEGTWANNYTVHITATPTLGLPAATGTGGATPATDSDLKTYNLSIMDSKKNVLESYTGISTVAGSTQGLAAQLRASALLTVSGDADPTVPPTAGDFAATTQGVDSPPVTVGDLNPTHNAELQAALDNIDIFNMLCVPDAADFTWTGDVATPPAQATPSEGYTSLLQVLAKYCRDRRALLLIDPPKGWPVPSKTIEQQLLLHNLDIGANAAFYYPRMSVVDPANNSVRSLGTSGTIAGVYATTDASRGVWKAPAGTAASLTGVVDLADNMNDARNGQFNPLGVNCLRNFPIYGPVSWGARTTNGADQDADQWKYVPVRRTALFIEESLVRGTKWVVFEPNDEPLWASIRLNVGVFMNGLYRQGAFQGSTPQAAYLVKCDAENNPQSQIDLGIVNILVGFAPLKPAEFVIINIQQLTGNLAG